MTGDRVRVGAFANNRLPTRTLAWLLFVLITVANLWLVWPTFSGD